MDCGRDAARTAVEGEEDEETEDEREREVGEGITVTVTGGGCCLAFGVRGAKTCDRMCNFRCN